jgi:roadblock/LC7 domain-containing protein
MLKNRWYKLSGIRYLKSGQPVQMFTCKKCGRGFSSRTFSVDYWEKRHLDYPRLILMATSCMSIRAMARAFKSSPKTVDNKLGRLSRQAIGVTARMMGKTTLREDLAADGFESFNGSQYFPNNFNILVGKRSQFLYFVNYSQLRRKGQMTDSQKAKAIQLLETVHIPRLQISLRFAELVDEIIRLQGMPLAKRVLRIYTDEKAEYAAILEALKDGGRDPDEGYAIIHHRISGKDHRGLNNELFPVNYMDREFRKDLAEHVRETTRFGRNVSNSVERMEIYRVHHNFIKKFRINTVDRVWETHAQAAGFDLQDVNRVMAKWTKRRVFYSHLKLDMHLGKAWGHGYCSPKKVMMDYVPAFIYM